MNNEGMERFDGEHIDPYLAKLKQKGQAQEDKKQQLFELETGTDEDPLVPFKKDSTLGTAEELTPDQNDIVWKKEN